jgi:hypothetical protein
MGHIKKPANITLMVANKGLSESEQQAISEFIKKDQARKQKPAIPKKALASK